MKYTKPEVAVLGEAVRVVEQLVKGLPAIPEPPRNTHNPAYDLDE